MSDVREKLAAATCEAAPYGWSDETAGGNAIEHFHNDGDGSAGIVVDDDEGHCEWRIGMNWNYRGEAIQISNGKCIGLEWNLVPLPAPTPERLTPMSEDDLNSVACGNGAWRQLQPLARELIKARRTIAEQTAEVSACIASIPADCQIQCREGGGPENVFGSLALSLSRMKDRIAEQAEALAKDAEQRVNQENVILSMQAEAREQSAENERLKSEHKTLRQELVTCGIERDGWKSQTRELKPEIERLTRERDAAMWIVRELRTTWKRNHLPDSSTMIEMDTLHVAACALVDPMSVHNIGDKPAPPTCDHEWRHDEDLGFTQECCDKCGKIATLCSGCDEVDCRCTPCDPPPTCDPLPPATDSPQYIRSRSLPGHVFEVLSFGEQIELGKAIIVDREMVGDWEGQFGGQWRAI